MSEAMNAEQQQRRDLIEAVAAEAVAQTKADFDTQAAQMKQDLEDRLTAAISTPGAFRNAFPQARMQLPAKFNGERAAATGRTLTLHTWLFAVHHYAVASLLPENSWVAFAASLLEGRPLMWYQLYLNKRLAIPPWDEFCTEIKARFQPINMNQSAREAILKLVQKGAVQTYCAAFSDLHLQIDNMDEPEAVNTFMRGLKEKVRLEVGMKEPTTLLEAMRIAERYDSLSWSLSHSGAGSYQPANRYNNYNNQGYAVGPTPMEIGSAQMQDSRRATANTNGIICYNCMQRGHISRNCREPRRNAGRLNPQPPGRFAPNTQQRHPPGNGGAGRR